MAEGSGSSGGGPNTTIIVVVALVLVVGIAIWAMTRNQPTQKRDGTKIEGSATAGDKDADVNLKVDLPDSVTIDAH
jgi:hypothetical protein